MTDYNNIVNDLLSINDTMFAIGTMNKNIDKISMRMAFDKNWHNIAERAAAAIEELQAKVPHWVRCDEALPEIGQRVIVYDGWMQFMTRKDDQLFNGKMYWENEEGNWERVDYEAYWMPIEPPKEDA